MAFVKPGQVYKIASAASSMVLDVCGGKAGNSTSIVAWEINWQANQSWEVQSSREGSYVLLSKASGTDDGKSYVMDSSGSHKDHLVVFETNGGANQEWRFEQIKQNSFLNYIICKESGKVVAYSGDGDQIVLSDKDPTNENQWWSFEELEFGSSESPLKVADNLGKVVDGETYKISSSISDYVLNIDGGTPENNCDVIGYRWYEGSDNSIFMAQKLGEDSFMFISQASGDDEIEKAYVLDSTEVDSDRLIVYEICDRRNQQWIVEPVKNNSYLCYIKCKLTGNVLEYAGSDCDQILIKPKTGKSDQHWVFQELDTIPVSEKRVLKPVWLKINETSQYRLTSGNQDVVLQVLDEEIYDDARIYARKPSSTWNQVWQFEKTESATFIIYLALETDRTTYALTALGNSVVIQEDKAGDNQQWCIHQCVISNVCYYFIMNKLTKTTLALDKNTSELVLVPCNIRDENQRWTTTVVQEGELPPPMKKVIDPLDKKMTFCERFTMTETVVIIITGEEQLA